MKDRTYLPSSDNLLYDYFYDFTIYEWRKWVDAPNFKEYKYLPRGTQGNYTKPLYKLL